MQIFVRPRVAQWVR